jgi:hypothetical protein
MAVNTKSYARVMKTLFDVMGLAWGRSVTNTAWERFDPRQVLPVKGCQVFAVHVQAQ